MATGEKPPAQVCREYGPADGLLRWQRKYEARGKAYFTPHPPSETEILVRRVVALERLCGQLALENTAHGALNGSPSRIGARGLPRRGRLNPTSEL